MRLESIDVKLIKKAVGAFLVEAWEDLAERHWPKRVDFEQESRDGVLERFVDERKDGCMRKYSLRLGNRRYPFMKVMFQELLFRNSFFFAVDTHDELDIKETTPDYAEWQAIRNFNLDVKRRIENEWRAQGVPTLQDVFDEVRDQKIPASQLCPKGVSPLIFVVDDDRDIAEGVRMLLDRRGFEVEVLHNAEEALARLEDQRPDLIFSDLEMGSGYTGLQFCERIRKSRRFKEIPFILATAAGIDLSQHELLDGFIIKPYEVGVLMAFFSQHLEFNAETDDVKIDAPSPESLDEANRAK